MQENNKYDGEEVGITHTKSQLFLRSESGCVRMLFLFVIMCRQTYTQNPTTPLENPFPSSL